MKRRPSLPTRCMQGPHINTLHRNFTLNLNEAELVSVGFFKMKMEFGPSNESNYVGMRGPEMSVSLVDALQLTHERLS